MLLRAGVAVVILLCALSVAAAEQQLSNGRKIRETHYSDGLLKTSCEYLGDVLDGSCKSYDKAGNLFLENRYASNARTGCTLFYENGSIQRIYFFRNGKMHGLALGYFESGKTQYELPYENDQMTGVLKEYFEDGALKAEIPHTCGKAHGHMKQYYANGKLRFETIYNSGEVAGFWTEYDEDGAIQEVKMEDDTGKTLFFSFLF